LIRNAWHKDSDITGTKRTEVSTLIGVLSLLLITSIYGLVTKENNLTFISLIAVAISLSAILPILFMNMKKIKKKINSRKENN